MKVIHDPAAFRDACTRARREHRVGLVPTMGALHAGHLALVDHAQAHGATFRVVTIFVNPLQFGEGEDLDRYPRTLESDVAACAERGVDVVFAPANDAMYPAGFQSKVALSEITQPLEGSHRPGHFDGVTTVVTKLFNLTGPCVAVFGRKDYQQWRLIQRMVRDLDMPIDVVGHPIVREADGLALSSRNRYLSSEERTRALSLSQGLREAQQAWDQGERNAEALLRLARAPVDAAMDQVDYVAIVEPETLQPIVGTVEHATLLVAAHIGATRLIDNRELSARES